MTTHPAPDALRLVPAEPTDEMLRVACATDYPAMYREHLRYPGAGPDTAAETERLIIKERKRWQNMLAAAPAVQPAAGREEIARAFKRLSDKAEEYRGNTKATVDTADLRAILAAISAPAQASGAWVFNAPHLSSGIAAVAQASETSGVDHADIAARLHPDLFSSDERTAHRAASPYAVSIKRAEAVAEVGRVLAAAAALSAPQAAPDPRVTEWGYSSTDEALTHLGTLLDDQAAFDGLAAPGEGEGES